MPGEIGGPATRARTPKENVGVTALTMLIGLGSGLSVRLVGDIFVGELAVLLLLPVALLRTRQAPLSRPLKVILVMGALWLLSLMVTDLIRSSAPVDYLRGWANILMFSGDLFVLYRLLYQQPIRQLLLLVAFAVGQLIGFFVNPTASMLIDPWKFGFAGPLALLALCVACWLGMWLRRPVPIALPVGLLAILVLVNLLKDFRAEAGICGVAISILLLSRLLRRPADHIVGSRRSGAARAAVVLLGMAATGLLVVTGYSAAAQDGLLGPDAQAKFYSEYQPGLAIIAGGRGEILVSSQAIADSPILGHGSWAHDAKYVAIAEVVRSQGYNVEQLPLDSPDSQLIPSHSHLFGAWVEAGILGALFWAYVLLFVVRSLSRATVSVSPYLPLCVYFAIHLTWDILFSPFSGSIRLFDALGLVLIAATFWSPSGGAERATGAIAAGRSSLLTRAV